MNNFGFGMFQSPFANQSSRAHQLKRALDELIQHAHLKDVEIETVALDETCGDRAQLFYPAVVVVAWFKNQPLRRAYHTLIVQTESNPTTMVKGRNGVPMEARLSPGEAYDRSYAGAVLDRLNAHYKTDGEQPSLYTTEAQLFYFDTPIDDVALIQRLLSLTVSACLNDLAFKQGDQPFDLQALTEHQLVLTDTRPAIATVNAQGSPVRTDVMYTLAAAKPMRHAGHNARQSEVEVAKLGGYVNIVPAGDGKYLPQFVTTHMHGVQALPQAMMMIAIAAGAQQNQGWLPTLMRQQQVAHFPDKRRDLGVLSPAFGRALDLLAAKKAAEEVFVPGYIFSLDIPGAGEESSLFSDFARAAVGHDGANRHLFDVFNCMTRGCLDRHMSVADRFCFADGEVLMGWGYDPIAQRKFDTRELDLWAIKTLMDGQEPQVVQEWIWTHMAKHVSPDIRLEARRKLSMSVCSQWHDVDLGMRVTFTSKALQAMARALVESGVMIHTPKPPVEPEFRYTGPGVVEEERSGLFASGSSERFIQPPHNRRWEE